MSKYIIDFKIEGMRELHKSLEKLGSVPQKHVTASARKGMNIPLKAAKAAAPVDTGNLQKGIILKGERSRYKGKKVYRIVFDPAMNDVFQKYGGYYPVSQEYGYFTRDGRYMPGLMFIHKALQGNTGALTKTMVDTMKKKIDAEIAKGGLR
ncbi:MAG: HK97 gp10 family phage protein [Clostridiales bacterium]|nr:HK97 gp10 family phage protein [Clostridiales bacterium]